MPIPNVDIYKGNGIYFDKTLSYVHLTSVSKPGLPINNIKCC